MSDLGILLSKQSNQTNYEVWVITDVTGENYHMSSTRLEPKVGETWADKVMAETYSPVNILHIVSAEIVQGFKDPRHIEIFRHPEK